ncbi:hypothetical protein RDI58_027583 [Solanum bulbocastanum]|uniref:Uncharacterized protein n=1 Tax=Solanum bulbocastanum TaxID=147425 RepID=A0AAN8T101_SOLBU
MMSNDGLSCSMRGGFTFIQDQKTLVLILIIQIQTLIQIKMFLLLIRGREISPEIQMQK